MTNSNPVVCLKACRAGDIVRHWTDDRTELVCWGMKHGKYWLILTMREQEWDSVIVDRLDEYGKIQRDLWYDSNTLVEII